MVVVVVVVASIVVPAIVVAGGIVTSIIDPSIAPVAPTTVPVVRSSIAWVWVH